MRVRATYAFDLYQTCVLAGQWARITVEQRLEGEVLLVGPKQQQQLRARGGSHLGNLTRRGLRKRE